MISYSDNSIVDITDLQALAEKQYDVLIEKIELSYSKQGRSSTSKVDEYIFICRPKEFVRGVNEKLSVIKELKPIVDNPAGFMHNYMARKPYNVVSEIIKRFCPDNGCVYDPMFGSGTTIIEASKLGRKAIGTDINLLAYKLCKTSLSRWDLNKVKLTIASFCEEVRSACNSLYMFNEEDENRILERCHFDRRDADLVPTAYWYKLQKNGKLTGRKKAIASSAFIEQYKMYANNEKQNISDQALIPNSRIAIKPNATIYSYFCNRNLIAIDRIIGILHSYQDSYCYDILELLVSSAINLIKLSDKKASSQMPYWLPQKDVTSRNAIMVIEQKAAAFTEGLVYLSEKCKSFVDDKNVIIKNIPAQNISKDLLPDESVDLILTDPPYTDQVPYLEYNQLWYKVMGWQGFTDESLEAELVVSDAPSRNKDAENFNHIFTIKENVDNMDFIKKYLTLSRCDLFFADKIIFVEGASERLLLPDMIEKCEKEKLFDSEKYKLPAQYYALIEIGGAYAYKFIPFADFLGLPCLILTDIDSMIDGRTKAVVSKGKTTSNATTKWWMRKIRGIPQNCKDKISLADIIAATDADKTLGKCHIEYQTLENGICGRSLEEAVMNMNRSYYELVEPIAEENFEFTGKSKTDFALNLICNNPNYSIPQYIKNGLIWLNKQRVLE